MLESASQGGVSAPGCVSARGGVCSGGCLLWGGVCSGGVCSGGCMSAWGCLLWGVSAPGGCLLWGRHLLPAGCAPGGCLLPGGVASQHALRQTPPCEQNDKQVQKYYLGHNFVAAGNYGFTKINRISSLIVGLVLPSLMKRFDIRKVVIATALVETVALILTSIAPNVPFLFFSYGILIGITLYCTIFLLKFVLYVICFRVPVVRLCQTSALP